MFMVALAAAAAAYGIWLILSRDEQGGRDLAGAIWLLGASGIAVLALGFALRGQRYGSRSRQRD